MRRALLMLAALSSTGCAMRCVRTASGTQYISAHFGIRETVANVTAATSDGAALNIAGLDRRPDEKTAAAIAAGILNGVK